MLLGNISIKSAKKSLAQIFQQIPSHLVKKEQYRAPIAYILRKHFIQCMRDTPVNIASTEHNASC